MPGALQADKLGHVLEVLAENVLAASREHRHGADAELEQLLFARGIVHYVNRDEVNAFFRKKLFRPETTASTRLGEQNEFVVRVFHARMVAIDESKKKIYPTVVTPEGFYRGSTMLTTTLSQAEWVGGPLPNLLPWIPAKSMRE
jgi:hypothetical protein